MLDTITFRISGFIDIIKKKKSRENYQLTGIITYWPQAALGEILGMFNTVPIKGLGPHLQKSHKPPKNRNQSPKHELSNK